MKCPFRNYFNWLVLFIYLVQLSFIFICCMKPSDIFNTNQDSTFWGYLMAAILYPPWILGSKTLMMDSIFFFCISVIPFLIIIYSQIHIKKFSNQKHVNFWCALVIRICQQFLSPFMSIPIIFRFSYLIEQVFILRTYLELEMIFSFIIATINIILQLIHFYFAAVFLIPIDFVAHSKADYYDGKYNTLLQVIRVIIAVICFEITYIRNHIIAAIVIIIVFFICFLMLYFRLTIQAHVSPFGQYLEALPFFVCPFMILFKYFVKNEVYSLILLLVLFVFFAILLKIYNHFMVKLCLRAFYPFMVTGKQNNRIISVDNDFNEENDQINNDDFRPKFLIGSVISVIRIVASEYSDPDCLLRFLQFQKKSSELKNSCLIEVVRFLALFPSKRDECLKQLKDFQSKSNFNCFMVFIFKKILKSLNGIESTEKNLVCLNNFYRSFLVHKYLYWVARREKRYFVASKEALSAAYFFIEVKNEFQYLMKRYTYDSFLHYYYADFYLSACGNFEGYLRECQIARLLDNRFNPNDGLGASTNFNNDISLINESNVDNIIVDPLLHPMSIINPKILQFCSIEESKVNIHASVSSSSSRRFNISRQASMQVHKKKRQNHKSSPVATFLTEKKYLIPLLSVFHIYVPIALFLYVIAELYMKDQQIRRQSDELYNISVQLLGNFYIASSTVYLPYLSYEHANYSKQVNNSLFRPKFNTFYDRLMMPDHRFFMEDDQIMETFISLPFDIINFYSRIQPIGNMTGGVLFVLERYLSIHLFDNYTIKDVLDRIPYEMDDDVQSIFNDVYLKISEIKKNAILLREIYKNDLDGLYICKVAIITIFVFAIISCIVYIFQVNCIYRNDKTKIEFLSSERLFSMFLLQESKKGWELLRQSLESSSDATQEISLNSARSSVNLSSIQFSSTNGLNMLDVDDTKPNQINTNNIQEPLLEMAVKGHNFNEDLRSLINSRNFIKLKLSSIKSKFSFFKSKKKKELKKYQLDEEENENYIDGTDNDNDDENDSEINFNDSNICQQAIVISRVTEKEGFLSYPYFHLLILLSAPLIFALLVIAMFQIPLSLVASTQEETFQNILNGESLANHSLILLNATFDILEKRAGIASKRGSYNKKKTKFMEEFNEYFKQTIHNYFNHNLVIKNDDQKHPKNQIKKVLNKYKFLFDLRRNLNNGDSADIYQQEEIIGLDEILSDLKDLSSFNTERCYEFFDIVCMSVKTALMTITESTTSPSIIATKCIPFIYLFTWNLFQDLFFSDVNELFLMKISNGTSFIISTVLLMLTVVHVSFSSSLLLKKAFNSLFHFPDDFLKPPSEKLNDNSKSYKGKMPKNVLIITSITSTDEIYSVSANSKEIINRNLNDLISLKMSEMFPKVTQNGLNDDTSQLCEFSITEKNKKLFRYSTEQIGCLTKTVLIEEKSPVVVNTREKSFVQYLNGFIPQYFAELYGKNDQFEFNYNNNFVICVRISSEIPSQMIEKCFNSANHISQNSVSINIISVDGDMITFSSISNCKLIVILLLIRDFIGDVLKTTKTKNCIYSIFVHFLDDFWINVVNNDEIYLDFHPCNLDFFRSRLFHVENGKIAFSKSVKIQFPSIQKITKKEKIKIDSDDNEESFYTIMIDDLSSKIVEFV